MKTFRASIDRGNTTVAPPGSASADLEVTIGQLWRQIRPQLGPVTGGTSFLDPDCRVMHLIELVDAVASEFGAVVAPAEIIAAPTVRNTASLVQRRLHGEPAPKLIRFTRGDEGAPLVLLPGSNGSFIGTEIARSLPAKRPCFGFEPPGVRPGERPHRSIRSIARWYERAIRDEFGSRPVVLIGLCLGGTVAHELTRLLAARGTPPLLLILTDTPCPVLVRVERPWSSRKRMARASRREIFGWLKIKWSEAAGLENRLNQIRRTYSLAAVQHEPQQISTDTILITSEENRSHYRCRDLGWAPFVRGGPEIVELSGSHQDILRFRSLATLSAVEQLLAARGL